MNGPPQSINHGRILLIIILVVAFMATSIAAFVEVRPTAIRVATTPRPIRDFQPNHRLSSTTYLGSQKFQDYNDDAFGLVFLGGSFAAQDPVFAGTFLVLSAAAAVATRQKLIENPPQLPGVVAGVALVIANLLALLHLATRSDTALQAELAVCSISILYVFVVQPLLNKETN